MEIYVDNIDFILKVIALLHWGQKRVKESYYLIVGNLLSSSSSIFCGIIFGSVELPVSATMQQSFEIITEF